MNSLDDANSCGVPPCRFLNRLRRAHHIGSRARYSYRRSAARKGLIVDTAAVSSTLHRQINHGVCRPRCVQPPKSRATGGHLPSDVSGAPHSEVSLVEPRSGWVSSALGVTSLALLAIAIGLVVEVFSDSPLQHGDPPPDVPSGLVAILALGIPCLAVLALTVGSAHSRKIEA